MMKNKLFFIVIAIALILPAYSLENEPKTGAGTTVNNEIIQNDEVKNEEQEEFKEEPILTKESFKQPISKRKVAKKFLIAMFCVMASSFVIFAGLSIYNRIRNNLAMQSYGSEEEPSSLETPDNLNDAIKSFLDRTHWEN